MNRRQRRTAAKSGTASRTPAQDIGKLLAAAVREQNSGRMAAAEEKYRRVLAAQPENADALHLLGVIAHRKGNDPLALALIGRAIRSQPGQPQHHYNLGEVHRAGGRLDEAADSYSRALALAPDMANIHYRLGSVLLALGRIEDALERLRDAARLAPADAEILCELGRCLDALGRCEEAIEIYRDALDIDPDNALAHFSLGVAQQTIGRFTEAAASHRRATAEDPDLADAWYSLALNPEHRAGDAEIDKLAQKAERRKTPAGRRATLHFALGRIFDRRDEIDRAAAHYHKGNGLMAALKPFDAAGHRAFTDRLIATFSKRFFADRTNFGDVSEQPVFIVGMPRSGSTLVQQILSSHPQVAAAGEHDAVRRMVRELPGRSAGNAPFPECVPPLESATVAGMAAEYLAGLPRPATPATRVTDKMLGNFMRLGLIALMFPNARVIHCLRTPLDAATSCYINLFAHGLRFTYGMDSLAAAWRDYQRLMAHWRDVLPLPVLDVRYEDLVAGQEGESRRMVQFCGLDWDPRCLDFHERKGEVRTASFWQVRRPVYASSVGRWRRYEAHMGPLINALGDQSDGCSASQVRIEPADTA